MKKGKGSRRGIVLNLTGHVTAPSLLNELTENRKHGELYHFEFPVNVDFSLGLESEVKRIFDEIADFKTEDGVTPLAPCLDRYIILPALSPLAVLLIIAIERRCGSYPVILSARLNGQTGERDLIDIVDLNSFSKGWRVSSRKSLKKAEKLI